MLFRRSLLQELISTSVGVFLILLGIVIAQRAGYLIQLAAKGILPNDAIATMLGFNIIKFLPMLLSLALFLSILMTLSRWYRDSEMIVWFSSGLGFNNFIRPIMAFTTPIVIVILILSLFTMPWATRKGEDYAAQLESRDELSAISPGVFKESAAAERVYFIESYDALGNIVKNIFVRSIQNNKLNIIAAQQGSRYIEKNGDNFLIMENGRRYLGESGTANFSTTEFKKYAIRVQPAEVKQRVTETISKSSKELFLIKSNANSAELQWRFAIPISALVLALLALPLSALDPRAGRSGNFALALVIYIIYINALSITHALVAQGKIHAAVGLWPVHLLFSILASYMFYRRTLQLPILPKILSFS
jgi:lipopolysaccharide export system permease protein